MRFAVGENDENPLAQTFCIQCIFLAHDKLLTVHYYYHIVNNIIIKELLVI